MIVSISDGIVVVQVVPTGIAPEGDRKCENSGQVGVGPIRHPEVRNGSEGRFLRRHEVGGRVQIRVPPEWAADQRTTQGLSACGWRLEDTLLVAGGHFLLVLSDYISWKGKIPTTSGYCIPSSFLTSSMIAISFRRIGTVTHCQERVRT